MFKRFRKTEKPGVAPVEEASPPQRIMQRVMSDVMAAVPLLTLPPCHICFSEIVLIEDSPDAQLISVHVAFQLRAGEQPLNLYQPLLPGFPPEFIASHFNAQLEAAFDQPTTGSTTSQGD